MTRDPDDARARAAAEARARLRRTGHTPPEEPAPPPAELGPADEDGLLAEPAPTEENGPLADPGPAEERLPVADPGPTDEPGAGGAPPATEARATPTPPGATPPAAAARPAAGAATPAAPADTTDGPPDGAPVPVPRRRRRPGVLVGALALVCLLLAGALAYSLVSLGNANGQLNARRSAVAAARTFAVDLSSYRYTDLAHDTGKVLAHATASFKKSY